MSLALLLHSTGTAPELSSVAAGLMCISTGSCHCSIRARQVTPVFPHPVLPAGGNPALAMGSAVGYGCRAARSRSLDREAAGAQAGPGAALIPLHCRPQGSSSPSAVLCPHGECSRECREQQLPDRPAWGHHLNQAWSSCSALLQPLQSLEFGGRADATQWLLVFTVTLPWLITDQFQPLQGPSEFD